MSADLASTRIAAIVVEDDFDRSLLQRVAGVANAMQALKAVGFNLVLVQSDEVVVRR